MRDAFLDELARRRRIRLKSERGYKSSTPLRIRLILLFTGVLLFAFGWLAHS